VRTVPLLTTPSFPATLRARAAVCARRPATAAASRARNSLAGRVLSPPPTRSMCFRGSSLLKELEAFVADVFSRIGLDSILSSYRQEVDCVRDRVRRQFGLRSG
jgi:hypothetical protein